MVISSHRTGAGNSAGILIYDEEFFYMICSVLLQHHGEYGENPRTVYAMIVHMIDDLEAQLTTIDDLMQNNAITQDSAGAKVKYNGGYLNILQNSTP